LRYFVDQFGKIIDCNIEHRIYAKVILKSTLAKVLKTTVRVRCHNRAMVYETLQKKLTDDQKRSISKLYREHACISCNGAVNHVKIPISRLQKRVKF
jgi:hypothetical protein